MKNILKIRLFIGVLLFLVVNGGCSRSKVYIPPPDEVTSRIILVNPIYEPGFYVELDKKEAEYLKERLEIRVAPGKHKLKIFNKETTFTDKEETKLHTFDMKVKVGQGEVKKVVLTWDDESYSCVTRRGSIKRREERNKKSRERRQESRPGMPGM